MQIAHSHDMKVTELVLRRYLIWLSDKGTREYVYCTYILQRILLLPSLSVSMQYVDFGLSKRGRVLYPVHSKPR